MKNKLGLLLKMQLWTTLKPRKSETKKEAKPMQAPVGGKPGKLIKPASSKGTGGYTALMVVLGVIMVAVVTSFSLLIGMGLKTVNMLHLLPALMMTAASVMAMVTTIYKANGMLFGFKDYDVVMSLPIKTSTIITSRLCILYVMNALFCMLLMVPSAVVYAILASPPLAFWPIFIVCLLLVPFVPVIIATIIGSFISWLSSHFKRKNGVNVVFTIIILLLWMAFCMNMNQLADQFVLNGEQVIGTISRIYPLVGFYTNAIHNFDMGAFAIYTLVSIGAFVIFVLVVSKFFKQMNASLTANRTTSDYKMQELKTSSPQKALFQKEMKRFSSSSTYVMNTGIGLVLLTIVSVLALVLGPQKIVALAGFDDPDVSSYIMDRLTVVAPIVMSFFMTMTCPSASSISLEGKSLWIVKSLPVSTEDVLKAKLNVNIVLVVVAILINATLINILLKPSLLLAVLLYVTPIIYGLFTAVFGMVLNLASPKFDWDTELTVIKRGMPPLVVTLVGMAITIVPAVLALFFGAIVLYIVTAVLAVLAALLYRNIITKGVEKFDSFQA